MNEKQVSFFLWIKSHSTCDTFILSKSLNFKWLFYSCTFLTYFSTSKEYFHVNAFFLFGFLWLLVCKFLTEQTLVHASTRKTQSFKKSTHEFLILFDVFVFKSMFLKAMIYQCGEWKKQEPERIFRNVWNYLFMPWINFFFSHSNCSMLFMCIFVMVTQHKICTSSILLTQPNSAQSQTNAIPMWLFCISFFLLLLYCCILCVSNRVLVTRIWLYFFVYFLFQNKMFHNSSWCIT